MCVCGGYGVRANEMSYVSYGVHWGNDFVGGGGELELEIDRYRSVGANWLWTRLQLTGTGLSPLYILVPYRTRTVQFNRYSAVIFVFHAFFSSSLALSIFHYFTSFHRMFCQVPCSLWKRGRDGTLHAIYTLC